MATIADGQYQNNLILISLAIASNVISIGANAFYNCASLQTITIPASVATIGANAFLACSKLTSVYFLGNAISANSQFASPFPTIYVTSSSTGWGTTFSGCNIIRVPAVVGAELPGGIKILNPSPTDAWSGPYSSVDAANSAINRLVRYKTMIVRITPTDTTIPSDLYWYRNGTADTDLVLFNGANSKLTTVPNLTLALPTKGGEISTTIGSGLAYTAGSPISVAGTGTSPPIYYVDVTSSTSITFGQQATVDVFMIGGGGGGGSTRGGGGGAGAYKNVGSILVEKDIILAITIGAGGAGGTTGNGVLGGDTFIQSGGSDYKLLRVKGGGGGGIGTSSGYSGGDGGDGGNGGGGGAGTVDGGFWGAATGGGVNNSGSGNNGGAGGTGVGGGGGGSGGAGVDGNYTTGGAGGAAQQLTMLNSSMVFGGGGAGGGGGSGGRNSGSSGSGSGYGGGGGSAVVSGSTGIGMAGGSGRVILKVKTPVNINPFTITSGDASVNNYPDIANTPVYKFEGIVSSYNRATGAITISNIQNITGSFSGATAYTFNVNTVNGANAGTNIEIITSVVNLSINSDIQMNGKAIDTSNINLYLKVPETTAQSLTSLFLSVNINGTTYKIPLFT